MIRQERRFGKIMRSFTVGDAVHENDISARFNDGLLSIKAPKNTPAEKPSRKISIS